ncbi:MAG: FMN-binding protein [Treponema sp.]|nr:FMN-binding protein [Treponema sp.]
MERVRMMGKKRLVPLIFLVALLSCGGNSSALKDGYYTAEDAEFDNHGWKEYVTLCISSGQISMVEYNAFNQSGLIKSWDMNYMRLMNAASGSYPNAYTRYYVGQLLTRQGTEGIDALSGATESYRSFLRLADAALENARRGDTGTHIVSFSDGRHGTAPAH